MSLLEHTASSPYMPQSAEGSRLCLLEDSQPLVQVYCMHVWIKGGTEIGSSTIDARSRLHIRAVKGLAT